MGYEINWRVNDGDPVLKHPLYQKYSNQQINAIPLPGVQGDLATALASNESSPIINYLAWLIRTIQLTA